MRWCCFDFYRPLNPWPSGVAGYDEYWLRVESPTAALSCAGCSHASPSPLRTATEVVQLNYLIQPPASVQSNEVRSECPLEVKLAQGRVDMKLAEVNILLGRPGQL